MTVDEIKAMVRRFVDEPWNKKNLAVLDEICAPDYRVIYETEPNEAGDLEAWKRAFLSYDMVKSPDFHAEVDEIIVEGDRVAYRWTMCWPGEDGKVVTLVGMTFCLLKDGKIVEDRFLSGEVKTEQAAA